MVIFDTNNIPYFNNQIFKKSVAYSYPGASSIYLLAKLCDDYKIPIYTADYVIKNNLDISGAKIITEIQSDWTKTLINKGAIPHALICLETPSFAWRFYSKLRSISKKYKHSFLFSGTKYKVSPDTIFHSSLFPQPEIELSEYFSNGWESRKFLVLLNSNQIRRIIRPVHIFYSFFDKSLSQEFYTLRLKAIMHFSKFNDFDLYGRNWHKKYWGIPNHIYKKALSKYKGSVDNKVKCLSEYRFSICFENASYPGYITEKIFDCFFAGCIPIYFGAPDVEKYIPKNCFIDFSDFNNDFSKLENFLINFSMNDYLLIKKNILNFFNSNQFSQFSDRHYANEIFNTLN